MDVCPELARHRRSDALFAANRLVSTKPEVKSLALPGKTNSDAHFVTHCVYKPAGCGVWHPTCTELVIPVLQTLPLSQFLRIYKGGRHSTLRFEALSRRKPEEEEWVAKSPSFFAQAFSWVRQLGVKQEPSE